MPIIGIGICFMLVTTRVSGPEVLRTASVAPTSSAQGTDGLEPVTGPLPRKLRLEFLMATKPHEAEAPGSPRLKSTSNAKGSPGHGTHRSEEVGRSMK